MCAAGTARAGRGALNLVHVALHTLTPVHLPEDVYRYITTSKVRGDLPALSASHCRRNHLCIGRSLEGTHTDVRAERGGGDAGADCSCEPKKIQEAYEETYRTLLRFGNAEQSEAMAPIWNQLANAGKSIQHTILAQEFQRVCMLQRGLLLSTDINTPVVSAGLK